MAIEVPRQGQKVQSIDGVLDLKTTLDSVEG